MKIVLSAVLALFLLGCGEDKAATNTVDTQSVVAEKTELVTSKVDEATKAAEVVVQEATKEVQAATVETKNVVEEIQKTADETTKEAVAKVKESAVEVSTKVEETVASATNVSGADLYKACASCHGQKGEKPALGKSQIITAWSAAKVSAALHGYKDGTYGGAMKSVMKGQASKLSDAQIQTLSEYISTL